MRIVWGVALLAAALLALAPSAADAHPGHSHARPAKAAQQAAPPAEPTVAPVAQAQALPVVAKAQQVLSQAADAPQSPAAGEAGCDGKGCCTSGPCTNCLGFVLAALPLALPPLSSTLLTAQDALPRGSTSKDRLRRPPKSFA